LRGYSFLHIQLEVQGVALPFLIDDFHGHDVVSKDVFLLAVIPKKSYCLDFFARLVRICVVDDQPDFAVQGSLGLEHGDPALVQVVLRPDTRGEKSVERAGVLGIYEDPVDTLYGQVLGDNQSEDITLEVFKPEFPLQG
jgi:hypothetical protein